MIKTIATLKKRLIREKEYGKDDRDDAYLRDRDRILFSRAFRRLAFKTQVVTVSSKVTSDHIRSRLTHSLEVMQIASSIALNVKKELEEKEKQESEKLNLNLIQAIALGHDIGHTPYGHVGEEAMFEFVFGCIDGNNDICKEYRKKLKGKLRHCFQSLKVCCFLEKHYVPDFYGLNLTVGTLDGIFKHSNLSKDEMEFYKRLFKFYCDVFWDSSKVDDNVLNDLKKYLFGYSSPVTLEGVIVSIADEIAQMCHDVEDLRRIGGFDIVKGIYENTINKLECLIEMSKIPCNVTKENIADLYNDFKRTFNDVKEDKKYLAKLERLYVKLILKLSIPAISNVIKALIDIGWIEREKIMKEKYLGKFKDLESLKEVLDLDDNTIVTIKTLEELHENVNTDELLNLPEVAKWDLKGKEICIDLANKLLEAFKKASEKKDDKYTFNVVDKEIRESLRRSREVGKRITEKIPKLSNIEDLHLKIAIWDYIAGMTDSFIIKEYESLTFKKVGLD